MQNPEFGGIAKADGIAGREVTERSDLEQAIQEMLQHDGPYLLIANVEEQGMVYPMIPAGSTVTNILMGE